MAKYRNALPQLAGGFFMSDGGIETTLIFLEGQDLPLFAAFPLLDTAEGEGVLRKYFATYAELARKFDTGLVLEAATWRASPEWAGKLGYGKDALAEANSKAVRLLEAALGPLGVGLRRRESDFAPRASHREIGE